MKYALQSAILVVCSAWSVLAEPLDNSGSPAGILAALGELEHQVSEQSHSQLVVGDHSSHNLSCYSCSTIDNPACEHLNASESHPLPVKRCAPDERFCSVLRIEYKIPHQLYEWTLWTLERSCQRTCDQKCIQLGERTRVKSCHSCCTGSLCNVNSAGSISSTGIRLAILITGVWWLQRMLQTRLTQRKFD